MKGTLEHAIAIAALAHAGQVDKAGAPYVLHPLRVMLQQTSPAACMAGVLHDVVEDNRAWTLDRLRAEGFPEEVVVAVDALTHRPDESYEASIHRAGANAIARSVKRADLLDNLKLDRIPNPTEKDLKRMEDYRQALQVLDGRSGVGNSAGGAVGNPDSLVGLWDVDGMLYRISASGCEVWNGTSGPGWRKGGTIAVITFDGERISPEEAAAKFGVIS